MSNYFDFCCFRAMTLLLLLWVVNWQVYTINICWFISKI